MISTTLSSWKSSLLQPGRYGNKEMGLSSKNAQQSLNMWERNFKDECHNQALGMKDSLKSPFLDWTNNPV
jgi:hypothetical protein